MSVQTQTNTQSIAAEFIGKNVMIRTYSAGVHYGTLKAVSDSADNFKVILTNARRVYQWTGAFTLSELSTIGSTRTDSKLSVFIPTIALNAIEIIEMTKEGYENLNKIPTFKP